MALSSIYFIWLIENFPSSCLKRSSCWPAPKWLLIFCKGLRLVAVAEHAGSFKGLLRNFNGRVHQTFLHLQVLPAPPLLPRIFLFSSFFSYYAWQESPDLHFARRVEANKNPDCVHMTVHLGFSILE